MNHDMPLSEVKAEQPKDELTQEIIRLAEEESLGEALEKVSTMKRKLLSRNSGFYGLAHSYWITGGMAYQEGPAFRWSGVTKLYDKMMEIKAQAEPTKKLLDAVTELEEAMQKALKAESRIIGLEASIRFLTRKMERAQELNQVDVVEDYKLKINGYYDLLKPAWEERDKQQAGCVEVLNQTDLGNYNPDQDPIDFEAARKKAKVNIEELVELTKGLHTGGIWSRAEELATATKLEVQAWMLLADECHEVNDKELTPEEYLKDVDRIKNEAGKLSSKPSKVLKRAAKKVVEEAKQKFTKKDGVAFSEEDAFLYMAIAGEKFRSLQGRGFVFCGCQ